MPQRKPLPPAQTLWELFDYKPLTGELVRKRYASAGQDRRKTSGRKANRYLTAWVCNRPYSYHRVVWKWVHGVEPGEELDHINRDGHDNRIWNLREVTREENLANRRTDWHRRDDAKGYRWVEERRRWRVQVRRYGKSKVKDCTSEEEAQSWAKRFRDELYK